MSASAPLEFAAARRAMSLAAERLAGHGTATAELQRVVRSVCLVAALEEDTRAAQRSLQTVLGARALPFTRDASRLVSDVRPRETLRPDRYYEALLGFEVQPSGGSYTVETSLARRRGGAHYTDARLARDLVERSLAPLLDAASDEALRALAVCDPAVGAGAFLLAARYVLFEARRRREPPSTGDRELLADITRRNLFGCDVDPLALWLARRLVSLGPAEPRLCLGDALSPLEARPTGLAAGELDWRSAFPEVFSRNDPGFDAVIGNPPWVAYVGRAAQPLDPKRAEDLGRRFPGFRGYKSLHGVFVEQGARLLRLGGRLGLLLPTSVADLAGYAGTREAHGERCVVDPALPDYGDRFDGVFQPCFGLLSTRQKDRRPGGAASWPLERRDLSSAACALLTRLDGLPKVDPSMFRERGYQTTSRDKERLRPIGEQPRTVEQDLFTGSEVTEFRRLPARLEVAAGELSQPFRSEAEWKEVALWVRQTARFPICCLGNGAAFRNSILAGFENDQHDRFLLLAYLNSTPIRWFHFHSQRDARQGMPQLKVAHLRALPAPPRLAEGCGRELSRLGRSLGERNAGLSPEERAGLDGLVAGYLDFTAEEAELVRDWGALNPPPVSRFERRQGRAP